MARRERLGTPLYYASREGVRFDGSDQSAAVQAILDRGQLGPMVLVLDGSFTAKGLQVHSGTTVEGLGWQTVITQATATSHNDSCIFRNVNFRSAYQGAPIFDHDIVIRDLMIDANARGGSSGGSDSAHDPDGWTISTLKFWGIKRLLVENVYIYDPNAYGVGPANIFDSTIRNVRVVVPQVLSEPPGTAFGTAAVQIDGPWDNILIDGISGATGDDFIALNAIDGNMDTGVEKPSDYPTYFYGSGGSAIVRNISCILGSNGAIVRLLTGSPPSSIGGPIASIDRVLVDGVQATIAGAVFHDHVFGTLNPGILGDIIFRNWEVSFRPNATFPATWNEITGTVRSFTFSGFRFHNIPPGAVSVINVVDTGVNIGRLCIDEFQVTGDSGESSTPCNVLTTTNGTIDELVVNNSNWSRSAPTTSAMLNLNGGTVNRVRLANVSANNLNHVVNVSGAAVGGIVSTGLLHRGAGGNASINVAGGTLSRLRAAGSDTALLVSGTVGSKKTDATEDA